MVPRLSALMAEFTGTLAMGGHGANVLFVVLGYQSGWAHSEVIDRGTWQLILLHLIAKQALSRVGYLMKRYGIQYSDSFVIPFFQWLTEFNLNIKLLFF